MDKTQEALKQALEALEYISSHYMSLPKIGCMALAAVEEALADQPAQQQEPGRNHWEDGDVFERISAMKKQPAQRTWVGLTDDEILIISRDHYNPHQRAEVSFARAIEAKLKEKNA